MDREGDVASDGKGDSWPFCTHLSDSGRLAWCILLFP